MPASLPTTIAAQFARAPIKAWASTTAGVTEYAARAVARKRTPLGMAEDLAEFARVATLREKPTWAQDAPEIRAWPVARLLDYSAPSGTTAVPTLVLPPQAGHASSIVDYGRDQSQMMTLRDGGLDRLFAIDWLPATDETAEWSIEGYVAVLEEAVQFLGGRVNLGDCQGGWLAVVYAGLHPEHVNTLTIVGHLLIHMPASPQSRNGLDCLPGATNSRSTGHLFVSVVVCSAGSTN